MDDRRPAAGPGGCRFLANGIGTEALGEGVPERRSPAQGGRGRNFDTYAKESIVLFSFSRKDNFGTHDRDPLRVKQGQVAARNRHGEKRR